MAQLTQYQPYGLPGQIRTFSAKAAAIGLAVHILSTSQIGPVLVSDSGNNLLLGGQIEARTGGFFGGATSYAKFATDGELTLAGNARVKKHIEGFMALSQGASAPTARITEAPYLSYTFAVNDDAHFTIMAPHDMDVTVDATVNIHWYTSVTQTDDEVNWQVEWNSRAMGETVNAGSTTDSSGDINCSAQWVIVETTIEVVPANSIASEDIIGVDLKRIAIVDGTNPQAITIHMLHLELEYASNKLGKPV